jgi:AcrR family transcriptional regulator
VKTILVLEVSKTSRPGDEALRKRIVAEARELFIQRGFAPVTTGEIAGRLGISKATLYKHFVSKNEILRAAVGLIEADIMAGVQERVADGSTTCPEKLVRLMTFVGDWVSRLSRTLIGDLRRNAPDVWEDIERFRRQKIIINFITLLEAGVGEGVFRVDIDRDLVLKMFLNLIQGFINPDAFLESRRSPREVFETLFKVVFEGILTDRARAEIAVRKSDVPGAEKEVPL